MAGQSVRQTIQLERNGQMVFTETERDFYEDGTGVIAARNFGAILAWCGSDQLLALAHAVIAQTDALPDFGQFTPQEHQFLATAQEVVKAYSVQVIP